MTPELCLNPPCRSHTACGDFGYCRERNMPDRVTTPELIASRQRQVRLARLASGPQQDRNG